MKFAAVTARFARLCVLACVLALVPTPAQAFPEPDGEFFVDLTSSVRGRDKLEIARTLRAASESGGIHAMLLVINRMGDHSEMPQEIIPFANKVAEEWKVGEQRTHKGVITVFALQDHKFAVATSKQLDSTLALDEKIKAAMAGRVTEYLKAGNVSGAMRVAASNIAEALPVATSAVSPLHSSGHVEPRRTTTTTTTTRRRYHPTFHYSGGSGFVGSIFGLMLMVFFFTMILRAFAPSSGGYGNGHGYGGGYGNGGGGGFWSGMFTGGMLGWMFGGHHGWGGYHYHGYGGHGGGWSDETTTTTTTTDYGSSSSDSSSSYDSSSSSSFDSFGGGDWGGGGSSGEW